MNQKTAQTINLPTGFMSYAQNFEDIMLWRALKHIKRGFYINIGAQDPHNDSVSRGFYEKGWRGEVDPENRTSGVRDKKRWLDEVNKPTTNH